MRVIVLSILLTLLQLNVSCQNDNKLAVKTTSEICYEITDAYCLIKCSITNTCNDRLVVWVNERGSINELKGYLLESHGDFSLLNLITERALDPNNQVLFKSFLKILESKEQFEIFILINEPDREKLKRSKHFFEEQLKYTSVKELEELINTEDFEDLFYQGGVLVLPYYEIK